MKILIVSKSWPSSEHSGVSLIASEHAKMLLEAGHKVVIVGSDPRVVEERLEVNGKFFVFAKGSGSFYSPSYMDKQELMSVLKSEKPDVVILESWQTAITDNSIPLIKLFDIPLLMISHGISIHPFKFNFSQFFRSFCWYFYKVYKLPRLIGKLDLLTCLDLECESSRFYDREIAINLRVPVKRLINFPINFSEKRVPRESRKFEILVIGYFSPLKNQMDAIKILKNLPSSITMHFIGDRKGSYYRDCLRYLKKQKLEARVKFSEDWECKISDVISESYLVLSTSITEVLPLNLLEAMASGTPFVANNVGAIKSLNSGKIVSTLDDACRSISDIFVDDCLWHHLSDRGLRQFNNNYTREVAKSSLLEFVKYVYDLRKKEKKRGGDEQLRSSNF